MLNTKILQLEGSLIEVINNSQMPAAVVCLTLEKLLRNSQVLLQEAVNQERIEQENKDKKEDEE